MKKYKKYNKIKYKIKINHFYYFLLKISLDLNSVIS